MNHKNPKTTTCAVIERNSRILVTKRNVEPYKGYWCLPGGHIEFYEDPEDAVVREIEEETGLRLRPKFLFYHNEVDKDIKWHAIVLVFTGDAEGEEKMDEKEVQEMLWINKEDIGKFEWGFGHKNIITRYLEEKQ